MRLTPQTRDRLPRSCAQPQYDRDAQACGIVHLGIGAFHRAHQAVYTDAAMNAGDRDWAITGVSLRSPDVHRQMTPQSGLYTVSERSDAGIDMRLIGAVRRVLVAADDAQAVIASIASAHTHIVSLTVTEKGYLPGRSGTIYDYLGRALARRRAAGLPGLTLLSCDNLPNNGSLLQTRLVQYLDGLDGELASWFSAECTCPSTMIDRIVPATTSLDRESVAQALGMRDEAAVITEPFHQWVIEDRFAGPRPQWQSVGAQLVSDVRPYEIAKLRMLNGAHSALAYLGLARGHEFVHEAVADPSLMPLIDRLMRREAAASLPGIAGLDPDRYADSLLARFANSALQHRLIQIAMDGSQKIPQRWLQTLAWHRAVGQSCPSILSALAAWIDFVRGDRHRVDDPMAAQLAALWRRHGREEIVAALFGENGVFAKEWIATAQERVIVSAQLNQPV